MRAVIQRVQRASCKVDDILISEIGQGLLIFLGIEDRDGLEDVNWLGSKMANLRIFSDADDKMNLSCKDIDGGILIISQFTLHASTKKGNRPSFINAAKPEKAILLYEQMIQYLKKEILNVQSGEFGADMKIELLNDGPVTIIIDSQDKH